MTTGVNTPARRAAFARLLKGTAAAGVLTMAASLYAPAALAQTAPPPPSDPQTDGASLLDEVVVTAQKKNRAEEVQSIPIAITAVNAAQLDALNVVTLRDLGSIAPNVALEPNGSAKGVANFTIRGIGANSSIASVEPTVGTFINGIYQGVNGGVVLDAFDLDGVEILRGPQGTLFGRNVTGGAVLLRTGRPTAEWQGAMRASVETGPQYTVAATVGGPVIGDYVLAKLTAYHKDDRGWFHNDATNSQFGEERTTFVRPTIVIDPHNGLRQTFIYDHLTTTGDGVPTRNINANRKFQLTLNNPGFTDVKSDAFTSETTLDVPFGNGVITNLFGYRALDQKTGTDLDSTANTISHSLATVYQSQYSNELRYAGTFFDRWDLTVGLYYFEQDIRTFDRRDLGPPLAPLGRFTTGGGHIDQSSYAAFTQSDIRLTDSLTATLGLRYSHETKSAQVALTSAAAPCDFFAETCNFNTAGALTGERDWHALTPKIGLRWQVQPGVMIFGSYSEGVRSGGYNLRRSNPIDPGVYDQERQKTYELGLKSGWLDRTLRINLTGFYNDIGNMQRDSNTQGPTGPVQILFNAVDAEIYGAEGEFIYAPTRALQLNANFGYTHGEYTDVRLDLNGNGVINEADYALKIPRLSPWTYNVGATYTGDVAGGQLSAHVDYGYRSGSFGNEANSTIFVPYRNLNANLTWDAPGGIWSASLYGRNLGDHEQNGASVPVVTNVAYYYTIQKGRQLGIELNAKF
ncbi:Pesticin receptor [Brevundimonas sp. NIBR10]|uniref:TonB-dependent receptor n=1 Tax=Brevundimonas sp. NIBR10 TaxID=3015997 RepID=UPI0022F19612|nr:TonB-dependent receptor [Brevundimonas sp. NIBR10]WGM45927.1 Pesticin receptor [Brevundimonas sp. NIBR10]